jgi:hypothetical protein
MARLFCAGVNPPKNTPQQDNATKKGIFAPIPPLPALLNGNLLGYDHADRPARFAR